MSDQTMTSTGISALDDYINSTIDISTFDLSNTVLNTGVYTVPNTTAVPYYGNVTVTNGTGGYSTTLTNPALKVTGPAEFDEDIKVKGISILENLEAINKRLAILQPSPEKLEKFAALKKAYEHYKTLEALCDIEEKKED